jgi:hypothetical protein
LRPSWFGFLTLGTSLLFPKRNYGNSDGRKKGDLGPVLRGYEKPDVVSNFVLGENPPVCRSLTGSNEKVGVFSSVMELLNRCKKSIIGMN